MIESGKSRIKRSGLIPIFELFIPNHASLMTRIAFKMQLFKGFEQEYRKRHEAIWPELEALLKDSGISNYSIFLDPDTLALIGVMDVADEQARQRLPEHPVMQKWWAYMKDIMATNADNSPVSVPLAQVFHMD